MAESQKQVKVTEGKVVKGGQNPVNMSTTRPPVPHGSGGASPPPTRRSATSKKAG